MNDCDQSERRINNYRLLHLLWKSNFSEVYLAEHVHQQTKVAVKLQHRPPEEVQKILAQIALTSKLRHPHIVPIIDFGLENDTAFLIMDYIAGGNLRQHHPRGTRVPLETVLAYVKQIATALQYIHDQNFIHRDIKPHNMLIDERNQIMLGDFGTAIIFQGSDSLHTYDFEGTILYAAPEQLQGRPQKSSDQYALGVGIYEWLCGDWLFSGSFHEIAHQHLFISPSSFRERGINYPPNIEQVILRALEKSPENRFASVKIFAEELEWAYKIAQAKGLITAKMASLAEIPPVAEKPRRQFKSPLL